MSGFFRNKFSKVIQYVAQKLKEGVRVWFTINSKRAFSRS